MRDSFRYIAAGLSLLIVVGCGDSSTAPSATANRGLAAADAPRFDFSAGGVFGDQVTSFTLTPNGGTYNVAGLYTLNFPANSVCNPARSTYGDGTWYTDCSTLQSGESIAVQARLRLTGNGLAVDFTPELRFNPNTNVTISTDIFAPLIRFNSGYFSAHHSALSFLAMPFASTLGGASIADYATDANLATHVGLSSGRVWRRILHFSGYLLSNGDPCKPSPLLPDCVEVDGDF